MMTEAQKIRIINKSVRNSVNGRITRKEVAERALLLADKRGVNIQCAPYLQEIFYAALDRAEQYFASEIVEA